MNLSSSTEALANKNMVNHCTLFHLLYFNNNWVFSNAVVKTASIVWTDSSGSNSKVLCSKGIYHWIQRVTSVYETEGTSEGYSWEKTSASQKNTRFSYGYTSKTTLCNDNFYFVSSYTCSTNSRVSLQALIKGGDCIIPCQNRLSHWIHRKIINFPQMTKCSTKLSHTIEKQKCYICSHCPPPQKTLATLWLHPNEV